jgi:hypothetical protein
MFILSGNYANGRTKLNETLTEEPYDGRLSRTVPREVWGEIPLTYSTKNQTYETIKPCIINISFILILHKR